MRVSVFGGLLVTALMVVGCGGPVEQEEGANLSTQEAPLPDCSTGDTLTTYYSDATYTNEVGQRGCECGLWTKWGTTSTYYQFTPVCN
jgi:hypothetical protein